MLNVAVFTHGHCFDGLCSAAMFTRLLAHVHGGEALTFSYRSMGYGPGQSGVSPSALTGDINAILDYRFCADEKLTWYFDHHVSAFSSEVERRMYDAHVSAHAQRARRMFFDHEMGSCTKLISDVSATTFDLPVGQCAELVSWADRIDSARFESAREAVDKAHPVLQLMTVVERHGDDAFLAAMVPRLLREPLLAVASCQEVQALYAPLAQAQREFVDSVVAMSSTVGDGKVVLCDLSDDLLEVATKFVTYAYWPDSAYSVLLTRSSSKLKLSIGYNPWSPVARDHNIARICERYGGGGHPVVGAVSLPTTQLAEARQIAHDIAVELAGAPG